MSDRDWLRTHGYIDENGKPGPKWPGRKKKKENSGNKPRLIFAYVFWVVGGVVIGAYLSGRL